MSRNSKRGVWKCFVCGEEKVGLESGSTFEEYGITDRDGLVQFYSCMNCGATYEVYIEYPKEEEKND